MRATYSTLRDLAHGEEDICMYRRSCGQPRMIEIQVLEESRDKVGKKLSLPAIHCSV